MNATNTNPAAAASSPGPRSPGARIGLQWLIGLLLLACFAAYSHWRWWKEEAYWLHAVPALALGSLVLIFLDGLWAFMRGLHAPRIRDSFRWLGQRDTWVGGAYRLALALTVIVLFYQTERWRGQRAWSRTARAFAAQGDDINHRPTTLPEVPDDQNFARLPVFQPVMAAIARRSDYLEDGIQLDLGPLAPLRRWDEIGFSFDSRQRRRPRFATWMTQESTDLRAWYRAWPSAPQPDHPDYQPRLRRVPNTNGPSGSEVRLQIRKTPPAASEVAEADLPALILERAREFEPMLAELRRGSDRPYCRFPLDYERQMWRENPALWVLNGFTTLLRLRASALLAASRPDEALADVQLLLRLEDYTLQQPWAQAGTYRLWTFLDALQPVWEGLETQAWSAAQLTQLQAQLERLDILGAYPASVRNEAFGMADLMESFLPANPGRGRVPTVQRRNDDIGSLYQWIRLVYPTGWSLQMQAVLHRHALDVALPAVDVAGRRLGPSSSRAEALVHGTSDPLFRVFVAPKVRAMSEQARVLYPAAQSAVDLAVLACALERHRVDHSSYPDSLEALAPRYLARIPHDLATGASLHYVRGDNTFTLYSAGANLFDEGGRVGSRETEGLSLSLLTEGDWVWKQRH